MLLGQLEGKKSTGSNNDDNHKTKRDSFRARVIARGGLDDQVMHLPSIKQSKGSPQHPPGPESIERRGKERVQTMKSPSPHIRSIGSRTKFTSGVFFGSTDKIKISPVKNKSVIPSLAKESNEISNLPASVFERQVTTKAVIGQGNESELLRSLSKISLQKEVRRKKSMIGHAAPYLYDRDMILPQRPRQGAPGRTLKPVPLRNASQTELANQPRLLLHLNDDEPTPTRQFRSIRPKERSQKFNIADDMKSDLESATVRQSIRPPEMVISRPKKASRNNNTINKPMKGYSGFRDQHLGMSSQNIDLVSDRVKQTQKRARLSVSGTSSIFNSPTNAGYMGMYMRPTAIPLPEQLMETPKIPQFRKRIYSQHKHPKFEVNGEDHGPSGYAYVKKETHPEDEFTDRKSPRQSYSSSENEFGGPETAQQGVRTARRHLEESDDDLGEMLPKSEIREMDKDSRTSNSLAPSLGVRQTQVKVPDPSDREDDDCYCYPIPGPNPSQVISKPQPQPDSTAPLLAKDTGTTAETPIHRELRTSSLLAIMAKSFDKKVAVKSKIKKIRVQADQGSTLYKLEHIQKSAHDENEFIFGENRDNFQVGHYRSVKKLGEGCFGQVYLVEDKKSSLLYVGWDMIQAMKVLEMAKITSTMAGHQNKPEQLPVIDLVKNEVKILGGLVNWV